MPAVSGTQYATRADLANLGLIGGVLSSISTAVQDAALAAASARADSCLAGQFVLPLTQWGQDLVRAVCIIAAYDLLTAKGYNPAAGADAGIRQRYLDTQDWLDEVSKKTESPSQVIDSSGVNPQLDSAGDFMVSDSPIGITSRGIATAPIVDPSGWGF